MATPQFWFHFCSSSVEPQHSFVWASRTLLGPKLSSRDVATHEQMSRAEKSFENAAIAENSSLIAAQVRCLVVASAVRADLSKRLSNRKILSRRDETLRIPVTKSISARQHYCNSSHTGELEARFQKRTSNSCFVI